MDPSRTTKEGDEKGRSRTGPTADEKHTSDDRPLELGYAPEFCREMSSFGVLGMSFCAMGILTLNRNEQCFSDWSFLRKALRWVLHWFYTCLVTSLAVPLVIVGRSLGLEREYLMLSQHLSLIS